ncbi:50S ribosomal protein P1 [Candidatus Micrarchaeota archaeon]|nr:50S ribosomal protein P1 [Candidatus Micrarchaeota archaeon]
MKDVYAALLLHSAGQAINEENVGKVLTAAGVNEDAAKIKALVTALDGVNIEDAVKQAAVVAAAPVAGEAKAEAKKDEKSDEDKEAEASAGLASLFG